VTINHEQLAWAIDNRDEVLVDLDRLDSKISLLNFIRLAWQQLEPANTFVYGWAVSAICEHLEAVSRGEIKRLLINVPPGCMKSLTVNVFWPAWEWGPLRRPDLRYISASYEKNLATRDLVRCRDLVSTEWFQTRWPVQFKDDQNLKTYYETGERGWRLASSVGGSLVGYRGDRIIVDDPHDVKAAESDLKREESIRWFTETVPTRLNKLSESVMVVIMQRLHERDVSGIIIKELLDDWEHLMLPMEFEVERKCFTGVGFEDPRTEESELLWPERFDKESVEQLKKVFRSHGGSYAEAAQLQQRPAPRGGGMFKRKHFQFETTAPTIKGGKLVRGWDLAATKDRGAAWTVGAKLLLYEDALYVLDIVRFRGTAREVEQSILSCAEGDGIRCAVSIPQDPGQAGKHQKSRHAGLLGGFNVSFSPESGSKEDRATPFAAQVEAGNVYLIRAPWNDAFLSEAVMFPASEFKDQIDALSRAYAHLLQFKGMEIALEPAKVY
jgi:predicted phage terminase large subunit-like protein